MNLETVEVCVEEVAIGNISHQAHGKLAVDLRTDVHQIGNLQGSPSMHCSDRDQLNLTDQTEGELRGGSWGGVATVQVVQPDSVGEVFEAGGDVRKDWTSGDPNQRGFWWRVELQQKYGSSQREERVCGLDQNLLLDQSPLLDLPWPPHSWAGKDKLRSSPGSIWFRTTGTEPGPGGPDPTGAGLSTIHNKYLNLDVLLPHSINPVCSSWTCSRPVSGELHVCMCLLLSDRCAEAEFPSRWDTWKCWARTGCVLLWWRKVYWAR